MNTKARVLFIAMAACLMILPAALFGQTLVTGVKYAHISPNPIPYNQDTGSVGVGVIRLMLEETGDTTDAYIREILLTKSPTDRLGFDWVNSSNTKVYVNTSGKYEATNPVGDPNLGAITLSGVTVLGDNVTITTADANARIPKNTADRTIWIAFDYPATLDASTPAVVNYYITSVKYGDAAGETEQTLDPVNDPNRDVAFIDYRTTFSAAGLVTDPPNPQQYDQGTIDNEVLWLTYGNAADEDIASLPGGDASYKQIYTLTLRYLGERIADVPAGGVALYIDNNNDGILDGGDTQVDTSSVTGTPPNATVTFGPWVDSDTNVQFTPGPKRYIVAANVDTLATPGNHIGFEVVDPSAATVFAAVPCGLGGGHVDNGTLDSERYPQKGYIVETATTPPTLKQFTITQYVPFVVSAVSPANGSTDVSRDTSIEAEFSEDVDPATLIWDTTVYVRDHLGATIGIDPLDYDSGSQTLTITPSSALAWSETYTVTITTGVENTSGDPLDAEKVWSFTVEPKIHPYVTSTIPASGAVNISKSHPNIRATFSEKVLNVTTTTFFLERVGVGGTIAGTVTEEGGSGGTVWNFTPSVPPLLGGTQYRVTVKGTGGSYVYDEDGLALVASSGSEVPEDKVWTFYTAADVPPAVVAVSPVEGATGVAINTTISAVFSKAILESSLTGNFQVRDPSNNLVPGAITYDSGSNTATFTPTASLQYNRVYTVTLTTGITDDDTPPVPMATDKVWTFKTFGEFPEPIAIRNKIQPGVNDHTLIFIPEPPAGPGDRVTVQVFTPTGKRVDTLVSAERYSEIMDDLPLAWYGKNGRGQDLGPGLYFIKISATKWSRTLKVMIVR